MKLLTIKSALLVSLFLAVGAMVTLPISSMISVAHFYNPLARAGYLYIATLMAVPVVTYLIAMLNGKVAAYILCSVFLFLLWRQGVLLSLAFGCLLFFIFLNLGSLLFAACTTSENEQNTYFDFTIKFILGLIIAFLVLTVLSIFKAISEQSIAALLIFGAVLLAANFKKMISKKAYFQFCMDTSREKLTLTSILLVFIFTAFSFSNAPFESDSVWYGYSTEYVLVNGGSFFSGAGLLNVVNYYPKLFEILSLYGTYFDDLSFHITINIVIWAAFFISMFHFFRNSYSHHQAFLFSLAILSIPAVFRFALNAKPDLISYYLLFGAATLPLLCKSRTNKFALVLACLLLAFCAKLTVLFYGPLVFCALFFITKIDSSNLSFGLSDRHEKNICRTFLALSMLVFVVIICRNYFITGLFIFGNKQLVALQHILGFEPNISHYITYADTAKSFDVPVTTKLYDFFLSPKGAPHLSITWFSNFFLLVTLITSYIFVYLKKTKNYIYSGLNVNNSYFTGVFFALTTLLLLLYVPLNPVYGGDGNYYIPGMILAMAFFISFSGRIIQGFPISTSVVLLLFITLHLIFSTSISYQRAFSKYNFNNYQFTQAEKFDRIKSKFLEESGIRLVDGYLEEFNDANKDCRLIASIPKQRYKRPTLLLPCRVELVRSISWKVRNKPNVATKNDVLNILDFSRPDFYLYQTDNEKSGLFNRSVSEIERPVLIFGSWNLKCLSKRACNYMKGG